MKMTEAEFREFGAKERIFTMRYGSGPWPLHPGAWSEHYAPSGNFGCGHPAMVSARVQREQ